MPSSEVDRPMQAFARYTDPEYMLDQLRRYAVELIGTRLSPVRCSVVNSRYKTFRKLSSWPKSTLSVCYRVALAESDDDVLLYAKVYLQGRSRDAWQQQRVATDGKAVPTPTPVHLPALDMIAWRFPDDPAMPPLAALIDPQRIRRHLPFEQLPAEFNHPDQIASVSAQVVKYSPEKCCTTRFLLRRSKNAGPPLMLYGKTYSDNQGRDTYARLYHFWHSSTALQVAQPLGYDSSTRTVWQLGVDGRSLLQVIDHDNYPHYVAQLARGLAAVHDSGLASRVRVTTATRFTEFCKKIDKLRHACPTAVEHLEVLATQVCELNGRISTSVESPCTIYGDFHIEQLLVRDAEVVFFDLDSFALGDPEQDLAEFIVALNFYQVDPLLIRSIANALLDAYQTRTGRRLQPERIYGHALVEYLDRAYRFYLGQKPGWAEALTQSLARHAEVRTWIFGLPA